MNDAPIPGTGHFGDEGDLIAGGIYATALGDMVLVNGIARGGHTLFYWAAPDLGGDGSLYYYGENPANPSDGMVMGEPWASATDTGDQDQPPSTGKTYQGELPPDLTSDDGMFGDEDGGDEDEQIESRNLTDLLKSVHQQESVVTRMRNRQGQVREAQPQQDQRRQTRTAGQSIDPFDADSKFSAHDPEEEGGFVRKLEQVVDLLGAEGIHASVEYPGALLIYLPDESELWFGSVDGPIGYTHFSVGQQKVLSGDNSELDPTTATPEEISSYVTKTIDQVRGNASVPESRRKANAAKLIERLLADVPRRQGRA